VPTVIQKFQYSGTLEQVTIPAGTTTIDMYLWGGAGAGGGSDAGGPGGSGTAGHYVAKTSYSVTANAGHTLEVAVGGGGAGGGSGGGAPGGTNGKGKTDYSGGQGGDAGPQPYSGAGGGGGGATTLFINGSAVAVAGGGGGGAGAGQFSNGTSGISTNSATAASPGTLGEDGADHSGDGGGGGAGGGGADGGKGGNGGSGDNGGTGGYAGSDLVPAGGSSSAGSGVTPGVTTLEISGTQYYDSGVAVGSGGSGGSAGNGLAVLVFNIGVQANYKVSGAWKSTNNMYYKVSGAWKQVTAAYVKVAGAWKALFNSGLTFISTAAGFGNTNGNTSSGTGGSGGGGGCFIAGTMITMADGTFKAVEQVDIRDQVAVGGFVFATGKFLIDDLFEYKGIKVSGTHMVKEDGTWTRVADSKHGKSLGDDEHIVYVFGSEFRRIIINGIEFTDYFEIDEKQKLLSIGEKFFGIWREHDRQTQVDDVTILNNDR
jgi:hypothetical protein